MGTSGGSFLQAPGLMKPHSLSGLSSCLAPWEPWRRAAFWMLCLLGSCRGKGWCGQVAPAGPRPWWPELSIDVLNVSVQRRSGSAWPLRNEKTPIVLPRGHLDSLGMQAPLCRPGESGSWMRAWGPKLSRDLGAFAGPVPLPQPRRWPHPVIDSPTLYRSPAIQAVSFGEIKVPWAGVLQRTRPLPSR